MTAESEPKAVERYVYQHPEALAKYEQMRLMQDTAQVFVKAGLFKDVKDVAQAMVKIMAGAELGMDPFASMTGFDVIESQQGVKVEMNANTQAALVKQHPRYDYRVRVLTETECEIVFYEDGEEIGVSPFTWADAEKAGLTMGRNGPKAVWKNYPRNMLFARAMTNGCAWFCPDLTPMRVYGPGEISGREPQPREVEVDEPIDNWPMDENVGDYTPPQPESSVWVNADRIDPETGEIIERGGNADFGGLGQEAIEQIVGSNAETGRSVSDPTEPEQGPEGESPEPVEAVGGQVRTEPTTEQQPEPGGEGGAGGEAQTSPEPPGDGSEQVRPEADAGITRAQVGAIHAIAKGTLGWTPEQLHTFIRRESVKDLTKHEAASVIDVLGGMAREKAKG